LRFFWKQKVHNWNKFYDVDCRVFHAASCGIFYFLIKTYLEMLLSIKIESSRKG
jgi:hypothetical protein